jgi:hypothetical protein
MAGVNSPDPNNTFNSSIHTYNHGATSINHTSMRSGSSSDDDDDDDNGSITADGYLLQGSQCGVNLHTNIPGQVELHENEVIHRVVVLGLLVRGG